LSRPILLDTCALIWIAEGDPLTDSALQALNVQWDLGEAPRVSPISAWEVGLLVARGRLALTMSPERWWVRALDRLSLELADMPAEILISSSSLPGKPPNDAVDRILAATAREQGFSLMTRDAKLLAYAEAGHMQVTAC